MNTLFLPADETRVMSRVKGLGSWSSGIRAWSHGLLSHLANLDMNSSRVLVAFLFLLFLRVDAFKLSLVRKEKFR